MSVIEAINSFPIFVSSTEILRHLRKPFLYCCLMFPAASSINKYYHFRFTSSDICKVFLKEFTFSTEVKVFTIIDTSVSITKVQEKHATIFTDRKFRAEITPAHELKSSPHVTRRNYLLQDIIDRYFFEVFEVATEFLKMGRAAVSFGKSDQRSKRW